jgi:oligopeptide/dipeptide ABC transporter ATP-binding protein
MDNNAPLLELKNMNMYFYKKSGFLKPPVGIGAAVDINMTINPGEIIALVGESGGGKTTIGNILTGLLKPTSGEVLFKGKDIHKMTRAEYQEYRYSVQLVQQDSYAALNPVRTIEHSLMAPILSRKIAKNRKDALEKVKEALNRVELSPPEMFLEKYPHQLSGGQRQRILMARAILMNPRLIVADEPVSMIDVSLRISILNLMARLNKELNIAFLYITHDLATARYIAQNGNITVLYLGKVVESGKVGDVIGNPAHPYLQALLTAVPIPDPDIEDRKRDLPLKSVDAPSVAHPPSGCRFHPRCIYADEKCSGEEPKLTTFNGRLCACHHAATLPEWSYLK